MMISVGKIISSPVKALDKGATKLIARFSDTGFMNKICDKYESEAIKNPIESAARKAAKFIMGISIASIVLKDGLGCYLYVVQSLNNKKIPEDKRKFVAALDLANGGLNIIVQIAMFFAISSSKAQKKLFDTFFGKIVSRPAIKGYKALLQKSEKYKNMDSKKFYEAVKLTEKVARSAFEYGTSLFVTTTLGKRVVVPFISTPLADSAKKLMSKNDKPVEIDKETKNTYDRNHAPSEHYRPVKSTKLLKQYTASHSS